MAQRILILDDDELEGAPDGAVIVQTTAAAIEQLSGRRRWDVLYLDHDLGPGDDAQELLKWLEAEREAERPVQFDRVYVHSMNPAGAEVLYSGLRRMYPTRRIPLPFKRTAKPTGDDHAPGQPGHHPPAAGSFGGRRAPAARSGEQARGGSGGDSPDTAGDAAG